MQKKHRIYKWLCLSSIVVASISGLQLNFAQTTPDKPDWWQSPGLLGVDVGMSHADHLWMIGTDGKANRWDTNKESWEVWGTRSDFIRIDASADGRAVAITSIGEVYATPSANQKKWQSLNVTANDVGLGGGKIWLAEAILGDAQESLLKASFNSLDTLNWTPVEGSVERIDVDAKGNVWGLDKKHELYFYDTKWEQIKGAPKAIDVGVGTNGSVYLVGLEQNEKLGGGEINRRNPASGQWDKLPGRLRVVSAGENDKAYGVNSLSWVLSGTENTNASGVFSTNIEEPTDQTFNGFPTLGEILGNDFPLPETLVDVPFEELRTTNNVVIGRTVLNGLETAIALYTPEQSTTPSLAIGHKTFSFLDYIPDVEGTALQEMGKFKNAVFLLTPDSNLKLELSAIVGQELSTLFSNSNIKNYQPYSNLELIAQADLKDFPEGVSISQIMQLGSTQVNVEASIDSAVFTNVTYRTTAAKPFYASNIRTLELLREKYGDSLGSGIDIYAGANNLLGKRLGPATITRADWVINLSADPRVGMWLDYSMPIANTSKQLNFKDVYTRYDINNKSLRFDGELAKNAANTSVEFPNLKLNDLKFSGLFIPPGTVLPEDSEETQSNFSLNGTGLLSSKSRSERRVRLDIDLVINDDFSKVTPTLLLQTGLSLADVTGEEIPVVGDIELTEVLISQDLLMGTAQLDGNKMRVARYSGEDVSAPLVLFMHENLNLASYIPEIKNTVMGGFTLGNVVFFGRDGGTDPQVFENAEALPKFLKDFLDTDQLGMFPLQVDNGITAVGYYEPGKTKTDASIVLSAEESQALEKEKQAFDAMGIPQQGYLAKGHFDLEMIKNAVFTEADDTTPTVTPSKSFNYDDFNFSMELAVAQFTPPKIGSFVQINGGKFILAKQASELETSFVSGMTVSLPSQVAEAGLKEIAMAGKVGFSVSDLSANPEDINITLAASTAINQEKAAGLSYASIASFDYLKDDNSSIDLAKNPKSNSKPRLWNDALGIPNFSLTEMAVSTSLSVKDLSQVDASLEIWSKGTLGSEKINIFGDINISQVNTTAPIVLESANLSIPGPIALSGLPAYSEFPKINEFAFSDLLLAIKDDTNIELSGSMDWAKENTAGKALLTSQKKADNTYENKFFARLDSFSINKLINDIPGPVGSLEMGPTVIGWQNAARDTLTISDMGEKLSVLFKDLLDEDAEITMANGLTAIGQVDLEKLPNNISSRDPVTLQLTGLRSVLVDVLKIKEPILLTSAVERDINQQFQAEVTANIPSFKISEIPENYIKFVDTKLALTTLDVDKLSFDTRASIGLPNIDGTFGNPLIMDGTVSYTFNADASTDLKVELGLPQSRGQAEVNTPEGVTVEAWNEPLSIPNFKFKDLSVDATLNRSATAKSLLIKLCGDGEFKELSGAACVEFDPKDLDPDNLNASNTTIPEFEIDPANAVLSIEREIKLSQLMNTLASISNEANKLAGTGVKVPNWPKHLVDATLKKLYLSQGTFAFEGDFSINNTLLAGKGSVVTKDNQSALFVRSQNVSVGQLFKSAFPLIKDVTLPESLFIVSTQAMDDFNLEGIPEKMYDDLFDGLVKKDEISTLKAINGVTMLTKMNKAVYDPLIPDEIESQFKLDGPLTVLFTADDNGSELVDLELSAKLPSFAIPQIPEKIVRFKDTQLKLKASNSSSISFETTADVTVPPVPVEGLATIPSIAFPMQGLVEYTLDENSNDIIKVALGLPKKVAQSTKDDLGEGVSVKAWDEPLGIPNFAFYDLGFEAVHTSKTSLNSLSLKLCGAGEFKSLKGNACVDFSPDDIQNASIGTVDPTSFKIEPANAVVSIERQIKLSTLVDTLSGAINAGSDLSSAGVTVPKWPANKVEAISNKFYLSRTMFALDGELRLAVSDDLQTVIQNGRPSEITNGKSVFDGKIVIAKDAEQVAVFARTDQPFSLSGIVPSALSPLDQLRMPYGVLTFSTQAIDDFGIDTLPASIFKEMFTGLIDDKIGAKISVTDGVGFLTRVNAEDFPNEVRDVLKTPFGLDKDVVLAGSIGGIFSGDPALAMYAKIDKINLPLPVELPLNLIEIKNADVELFLKTSGPASGSEIGLQTGAWLNVPHLDNPKETDRIDTTLGISSTFGAVGSPAKTAISAKVEGVWINPMGLSPYSLEDTEVKIGVEAGAATIEIYSKEATFKDKKFSLDLDSAWVGIIPKQLNIQFAKTSEQDLILEPAIQAELAHSVFKLAMKSSSALAQEIKAVIPVESGGLNPLDIFTGFSDLMGSGADGALDLIRNSPLNMVKIKNPEIYFATPGNSLPPRKNVERPPLGLGLLARGEMIMDIGPINQTIADGEYKINLLDGYLFKGSITPPSIFKDSSFKVSASQQLLTQTPNGLVLDGKIVIPGLPDIGIPAYVQGKFEFKRPGFLGLGANVDADVSFGGIIQRQGTMKISTDSMSIQSSPSNCLDLPISISGSLSQDNFLNPESYVGLVNVVDLQHIADCLNLDNLLTAALNPSETVDQYMTALDATPLAQVPGYGLARGAVTEVTNVTAAAEGVIKSVPGVGELMAATEKAQKLFAEAPGAKETMAALGEAQKLAGEALEEMKKLPGSEEALAAASAVVDIAKNIPGKDQAMAAVTESIKIAGQAMEAAKDVPGAKQAIAAAEEAMALAQSMPGLGETMALAGDVMGAMKEVPGAAEAQAAAGEAAKVAGQAAAEAGKTAKAVGEAAKGLMDDAVAVAKDPEAAAQAVGQAAEETVNVASRAASRAANDAVSAISDAGQAAINAFSSAFSAIGNLFGGSGKNPCNAVWEAMYPHGTNPDRAAVTKMWTTLENFYKATQRSRGLRDLVYNTMGQVRNRQATLDSLSTDWNNFITSTGSTNYINTAADYHNANKGWGQNSWKFNEYYKDKILYQGANYSLRERKDLADKKAIYKFFPKYIEFLKTWQKNRNFDPNVDHPGFRCEKQRSVYMMMEAAASLGINIQNLPGNAINTNTLTRARYDNAFKQINNKRVAFDKVTVETTNYLKNIRKTGSERDYKFIDDLIKRSTFIAIKSKFRVETSDDIAKKNTSLYLKQEARTNTAISDFTKKAQEFIKQGLPRAKAQAIGLSFTDVILELRALLKEEEYLTNSVLVSDENTPTTPISVNKNITGFVLFNQTPLNTFLTIQDFYTGEVLADTITDEFGEYVFYDLPPNDYLIVKENPTDYIGSSDTYGANDNTIRVSLRDTDSSDNNFYHTKSPTIYGRVVLRNNKSYNLFGAPTASNESTALFGQTLILQGVGDNSEVRLTTTSDWLGNFQFKGFKLGQYQVTKLLDLHDYTSRDGSQYRYQNEPRPINVSAPQDYDMGTLYYDRKINDKENAVDDGVRALQLGTIKGYVLGTINNQFTSPEQSGLSKQFVYLSGRTTPNSQTRTPAKNIAAITTTDQSGQYEFKDLENGTYTVEVIGHKNGSTHFLYTNHSSQSASESAYAFVRMWIEENQTEQNRYNYSKNPWRYVGRNNGFGGSRQEYNFTRLSDPRRQQRLSANVNVVDRKASPVSDFKVSMDVTKQNFSASLTGRVVGTNGGRHTNPDASTLVNQTITLRGTSSKGNPVNLTALTDINGKYTFNDLVPGNYSVSRALDRQFERGNRYNRPRPSEPVSIQIKESGVYPVTDIKANIDVADYRKVHHSSASVTGRMVMQRNRRLGVAGQTLILRSIKHRGKHDTDIMNMADVRLTMITDESGQFKVEGLPPGRYEIISPDNSSKVAHEQRYISNPLYYFDITDAKNYAVGNYVLWP